MKHTAGSDGSSASSLVDHFKRLGHTSERLIRSALERLGPRRMRAVARVSKTKDDPLGWRLWALRHPDDPKLLRQLDADDADPSCPKPLHDMTPAELEAAFPGYSPAMLAALRRGGKQALFTNNPGA